MKSITGNTATYKYLIVLTFLNVLYTSSIKAQEFDVSNTIEEINTIAPQATNDTVPPTGNNLETIDRTYRVSDAYGNYTNVQQNIPTKDNTKPTADKLPDVRICCFTYLPDPDISVVKNATDNYTTNPTVTFVNDTSDGLSNPQTITRVYRVSDKAGNFMNLRQKIIIHDTVKPTAIPLANIMVTTIDDIPAADIYTVDPIDNCNTEPIVTFVDDVSDEMSNPETITRTYRITDEAGNYKDVKQRIIVGGLLKPSLSDTPNNNVVSPTETPITDGHTK
ncbi:hypothetical protein [Tenacibaculum sp. MAR_2009_124]|uniref:hypothetical protein n=1 Tax=Tenacibaculum sp. MAR_2009_124 TaxID=1250059 RepID=UPI000B82126B|nr:hypothetical protein [Tenacibaculum sp. MAR_2009_124]